MNASFRTCSCHRHFVCWPSMLRCGDRLVTAARLIRNVTSFCDVGCMFFRIRCSWSTRRQHPIDLRQTRSAVGPCRTGAADGLCGVAPLGNRLGHPRRANLMADADDGPGVLGAVRHAACEQRPALSGRERFPRQHVLEPGARSKIRRWPEIYDGFDPTIVQDGRTVGCGAVIRDGHPRTRRQARVGNTARRMKRAIDCKNGVVSFGDFRSRPIDDIACRKYRCFRRRKNEAKHGRVHCRNARRSGLEIGLARDGINSAVHERADTGCRTIFARPVNRREQRAGADAVRDDSANDRHAVRSFQCARGDYCECLQVRHRTG